MTIHLKNCTTKIAILGLTLLTAPVSWANTQVGSLTEIEGTVKILSHPSKTLKLGTTPDGLTHVRFEGEYFIAQDAKVGSTVEQGNIVRTTLT